MTRRSVTAPRGRDWLYLGLLMPALMFIALLGGLGAIYVVLWLDDLMLDLL